MLARPGAIPPVLVDEITLVTGHDSPLPKRVKVEKQHKQMKMKLIATVFLAVGLMSVASHAISITSPLSYSTFGLVGTYDGKIGNSSVPEEITAGQAILDAVGLGTISGPVHTDNLFDYSGTLTITGAFQGVAGATSIPAGWDYALAKYDGQNAGYALFYLGGTASTIPAAPYNIWTTGTDQYALSHWTVFNGTNEINPTDGGGGVPDNGSTLTLLGMGLTGLGMVHRKMANKKALATA